MKYKQYSDCEGNYQQCLINDDSGMERVNALFVWFPLTWPHDLCNEEGTVTMHDGESLHDEQLNPPHAYF